eukprot:gnl/TRDRNA2_/TRDRNA2_45792_c0_seq1.p2 gnl/TRDRNA2_/TRDRNA2_45792_c0~~gnl/TRDRNA2_/TRDRNA2_45792_c0_seq1.p2  ORF type:complete len:108 (-),score=17.17 gnl/TRDRNA2_/TRDRNA2_45792_c0_seq1:64-387(-)
MGGMDNLHLAKIATAYGKEKKGSASGTVLRKALRRKLATPKKTSRSFRKFGDNFQLLHRRLLEVGRLSGATPAPREEVGRRKSSQKKWGNTCPARVGERGGREEHDD